MIFIGFGFVIALAAAARSTWSPCGLSMLSQITPLAEAGRGQKFGRTAGWFIFGALLGGVSLGIMMAGAACATGAAGFGPTVAIALVGSAAFVGAAVDAHALGFGPPFLPRQVNEEWLAQYRSWVYGIGFGWQIGAGVTTYVMTAAVPLMIVIGALSANPWIALAIGALFGLGRGLAVLLAARIRTPDALYSFHRRFDAWTAPVRRAVIGGELAVAAGAAWIVAPGLVAAAVTIAAVALFSGSRADATFGLSVRRRARNDAGRRTNPAGATASAAPARPPM